MNVYKNQIGLIGVHNDGEALLRNLTRNCMSVSVFDFNQSKYEKLMFEGFRCFNSIEEMVSNLTGLKIVFITSIVETKINETLNTLFNILPEKSIIIDATNHSFKNSVVNYKNATNKKIHYLDCAFNCDYNELMNDANIIISGNESAVDLVSEFLGPCCAENSLFYSGKIGSASFIKMIQEAMELSMVKSIAEGMDIINESIYNLDIEAVVDNFSRNSPIAGKIINKFKKSCSLDDSCNKQETISALNKLNQTIKTALDYDCTIPVLSSSFYSIEQDLNFDDELSYIDENINNYYSVKNKLSSPEYLQTKKQK